MRSCPRGFRRSVDRGAHRPAIEPRKFPILGADAVQMAEGSTFGRGIASVRTTRRGQRPWHVQTLLAREPGDLAIDRLGTAAGRGGRSLKDEWSRDIRTTMGLQIHGYPNLFTSAVPLAPSAA